MKKTENKGQLMEEQLRHYFIGLNYFVLRGVKFKFNNFDVTDIDLWLYVKNSPLSRERTNIDIKNKKTPQALERIFWAKGLQTVLGLDRSIVATTDSRPDVAEFGLKHGVSVFDGKFLSRLQNSDKSRLDRLSEEDFTYLIQDANMGKLAGDWIGKYENAKSRVLSSLDFDGCNAWLNDIRYFFEQAQLNKSHSEIIWRIIFSLVALFLVGIDFTLKDHISVENDQRKSFLIDGFRYGNSGKTFTDKITKVASALVGSASFSHNAGKSFRDELEKQTSGIRAELLAEFFSKHGVQNNIFELAKEFESAAYSAQSTTPSKMSANAQSVLGVLTDFFEFDRKVILI